MRVFVALSLPDPVRSRFALLQVALPLPRRVPPENFHLTLAFLGDVGNAALDELDMALSGVSVPRFSLQPESLGVFGGARPRNIHFRFAPEPLLDRLAAKVARAARDCGIAPESRRFMPHVTLARFNPDDADQLRLERAVAGIGPLGMPAFEVDSFSLYRSHLRADGAEYDELARYPLG